MLSQYNYKLIQEVESPYLKNNIPQINVGDVIRISLLIYDGNKERIQMSQGVIISIKNAHLNKTITIRKNLEGVGVERVYLIHSPKIIDLKIIKKSKVRRAKLYFLREKYGKATRLKQKF